MSGWQLALLIWAMVVAVACRDDRRALGWIALGVLAFVASTGWQRLGLPRHEAATGAIDGAQALLVYAFARARWELWLMRVWTVSLVASILVVAGSAGRIDLHVDHAAYVIVLEICNWVALLVIGGSAAARAADDRGRDPRWSLWALRPVLPAFREARPSPPWWRVP